MNTTKRVNLLPYVFMLPALLLILVYFILPFICSIFLSLTDFNGMDLNFKFIGIKNYISMLSENSIGEVLINNMKFFVILVFVQNFIALVISILLYKVSVGKTFFRAVIFLPTLLSMVAVSFMWNYMLDPVNGVIKSLTDNLGIKMFSDVMWLGDSEIIVYVLAVISMWQWTGWNVAIYLAGLTSIPADLYESADIDGARFISKFRHITLPMLAPAFTVNIVVTSIGALKLFDLPFIMTGGGPGHSSETIAITIYNNSFLVNKVGYGTALSIVLSVLVLVISIFQALYLKRAEEDIN